LQAVIRSTGPTRAALLLSVIAGVAALATGCGHKRTSIKPRIRPELSVATVEKAFAAERLPLRLVSRSGGVAELGPTAWNLVEDFTVSVWPPTRAPGTLLMIVQFGHHTVRVRNVVVDYAPASTKIASVRSAITRLRRS
jgi:hypothetical protein